MHRITLEAVLEPCLIARCSGQLTFATELIHLGIPGSSKMKFEDEYIDVLQNIEFAIISVYREHNDLRDYAVMRALDALIEYYRADSRGHSPKKFNLPEREALIFQRTKDLCEFRLGRGDLGTNAEILPAKGITVDEILACLRRIRRSVDRWNKQGGQQGYLKFASQFIK